jgi:hypothetical protein
MRFIKKFENYSPIKDILIIVDVQKSFRKFFTEMYLHDLNNYCKEFNEVYQIFDNHVDGKNVDKDYLYDSNPDIPVNGDLYKFPNQKMLIEKRYLYNVNVTFFKKILDKELYKDILYKEQNKKLKMGDYFFTKYDTIIVYIGNNHNWFHVGKKLLNFLKSLKGKTVTMVGGSSGECFLDLVTTAKSIGIDVEENGKYVYSASYCPIK